MREHSLLLEHAAHFCLGKLRENRLPFLFSCLVGLACYAFALTNKLVNHDEVHSLFLKGGTVTSGRWGLGALDSIFPNISMPWIYGLITIVLISAAACVIIRCLSVENKTLQCLLAGSIMAFPSLIGTFGYMFTVSSFALSFLLSTVSVWLLLKKKPLFVIPALGCLIFSLSIYQSYISVAAGLLVLILIRRLLNREDVNAVIRTGIGYVLFLAAALGLYYLATNVILFLLDLGFNDYSANNIGFSFAGIPAAVATAYRSFFRFFTESYLMLIPTPFSATLHRICLLSALVLLAVHCFRIRTWKHCLLLLALTGLMPLAINCMYLFTTEDSIHTLVLYGFVHFYSLMVLLADQWLKAPSAQTVTGKIGLLTANVFSMVLALILVCNCYVANAAFLNLHLRYENAYSFYTALLADIQTLPEFTPGCKIAILGDYQDPEFYDDNFEFAHDLTGVTGFKPDSYSKQRFLEYYLGISLPFASQEEQSALLALPEVQAMPQYPYYSSIIIVDDIIVVKLS